MPSLNRRQTAEVIDFLAEKGRREEEGRRAEMASYEGAIRVVQKIPKRNLTFGAWQWCIPRNEYDRMVFVNPELASADGPTRRAAWQRFQRMMDKSPAGRAYRADQS